MAAVASSYDDDQDTGITDINVTPLVDIVLVLLIVFMITVPTIVAIDLARERELETNLPEVVQAQPMSMTPELVINVTREGRYKVVGKEYSEKELATLLHEARRLNPDQSVLIRGDANSAWRYGVRVMGLCNQAKIKAYRVAALQEG
jgi:biopolymer transport protein ExbD